MQGALEEWNEMFKKHGLNMNLDKTEVMWIGKQREDLNIRLVGTDIKHVNNLVRAIPDSCVVPASTHDLETLALSELHQHKLQVCENNWIRIIARVRIVERWRMKDQREEVGTKACIVGKIVKTRMKWDGHIVRMKYDTWPKRSETRKQ